MDFYVISTIVIWAFEVAPDLFSAFGNCVEMALEMVYYSTLCLAYILLLALFASNAVDHVV